MQKFHYTLKSLIDKKNLDLAFLIQQTRIDRSTVYKYINGKRLPTLAHLDLLAGYIQLSPNERSLYYESYKFSKLGFVTYYQRKNVENFFSDFPKPFHSSIFYSYENREPENLSLEFLSAADESPSFSEEKSICQPLHSAMELQAHIYHLLEHEFSKPEGSIQIYCQPDFTFLFDFLNAATPQYPVSISHILYLNTQNLFNSNHTLYNLHYLRKILPLAMNLENYSVQYYYNNASESSALEGLRNFVITSQGVVQFTSDYKSGIFHTDPIMIAYFQKLFEYYRANTISLFSIIRSPQEQISSLGYQNWGDTPTFIFQHEPCFLAFVTKDLFEKYLVAPFNSPEFIDYLLAFTASRQELMKNDKVIYFYSQSGVKDFLETGTFPEIHPTYYRPFEPEDRMVLVQRFYEYLSSGHIHTKLIRPAFENLTVDMHLTVSLQSGYMMFEDHKREQNYLAFQESSFLQMFHDYLANLDEEKFCTKEEEIMFLEKILESSNESQ